MATVSAFGFGGTDHPNSFFEEWMSRRNARWNSALQWDYAKKEALEGPSLRRQGLVSAGYNPLLAVSGAANPLSGSVVNSGYDPNVSFGESGMTDSSALAKFVDSVKQRKLETEGKEIQNSVGEANVERIKAETTAIESETKLKKITTAAAAIGALGSTAFFGSKIYSLFHKSAPVPDVYMPPFGFDSASKSGGAFFEGSQTSRLAPFMRFLLPAFVGSGYAGAMSWLGRRIGSDGDKYRVSSNEMRHRSGGLGSSRVSIPRGGRRHN